MTATTIKFYFQDEVRRSTFDMGAAPQAYGGSLFAALSAKLASMCQGLDLQGVAFSWKDSEGEMIAIANDEDTREAFRTLKNGEILRIYGTEKKRPTPSAFHGFRPPRFHPQGFGMGAPSGPGFGPGFFTAAAPPSYATTPTQETPRSEQAGDQNGKKEDNGVHAGVVCDACDGPVQGNRYKCLVCADYDLCADCEGKKKHDEHPMVRISSPQDKQWKQFFYARMPFPPPPPPHCWNRRGNWCRFARDWQSYMQQAGASQTANEAAASAAGAAAAGAAANASAGSTADMLKTIGENIAAVLTNFGIDVDIDVEHGGKRQKVTPTTAGTETTATSDAKGTSSTPDAPVEPAAATEGSTPILIDIAASAPPAEPATNTATPPETGRNEWMLVNAADALNGFMEAAAAAVYPDLRAEQSAPEQALHPNPKIANALQHLMAMGFENEGGWLTQLLEAKNGDINAVLDALTPGRRA